VLSNVPSRWTAWKAQSLARHPLHAVLQADRMVE